MVHLAEGTLRQNFKIRRRAYTPKLEKNRRPELGARPDLADLIRDTPDASTPFWSGVSPDGEWGGRRFHPRPEPSIRGTMTRCRCVDFLLVICCTITFFFFFVVDE
jgi:hypothetical protein